MSKRARVTYNDETVESPARPGKETARSGAAARGGVALVEGSAPRQSQETLGLLANRLRTVALLLGAGFAVFLLRELFSFQQYVTGPHANVFFAHVVVTLLLALLAQRLCVKCEKVHNRLRVAELLIFGGQLFSLSSLATTICFLPR